MTTQEIFIKAKETARLMRAIRAQEINEALLKIADAIVGATDEILAANEKDI